MRSVQAYIYGVLCLILILCIGVIAAQNVSPEQQVAEEMTEYILDDTVVKKDIYYSACQHLVTEKISNSSEFNNKSFEELAQEGWYVFWGQNGEACVFAEEEGLCPQDAEKYHLVWQDDSLVIVHGPAGYNGEVEGRINVDFDKLPKLWQELLQKDGVEFANRDELLTALESLDEL